MAEITFHSAHTLFNNKEYSQAFEQFGFLSDSPENPAFSSYMAGQCLLHLEKSSETVAWYQKAISCDDSNAYINREVERFMIDNNHIGRNKKIVWHYFPNTTNIGDSGSAAGIRAMMNKQRNDLFFVTLSCRNDTLPRLKAANTSACGMIIGGGGLFFRQPLGSGWYFPLTSTDVASLNLPVFTYAVGFNQEHSSAKVWQLTDSFIGQVASFHQHVTLKSVRDRWSKKMLEEKGVTNLVLAPCPSAFLEPLSWYRPAALQQPDIVGISITNRALTHSKETSLMAIMFSFATWLSRHGFYPLFILQDSSDDLPLAKAITENHFSCIMPNTAREAVSLYDRCCFVVGMRGHSLILAAGRCVPMLAISYNTKVDAFMELLDLQPYCVHQDDVNTSADLIRRFERCYAEKNNTIAALQKKHDAFYTINMEYSRAIADALPQV